MIAYFLWIQEEAFYSIVCRGENEERRETIMAMLCESINHMMLLSVVRVANRAQQ